MDARKFKKRSETIKNLKKLIKNNLKKRKIFKIKKKSKKKIITNERFVRSLD